MFGRKKKQQKKEEHRQAVRKGLLFWLPGGSSRIDVYLDYCVVRCLGKTKLPEKERMTILLRYFKGLTQERTARVLGVSQVQVSRLERRGLERLRKSLPE